MIDRVFNLYRLTEEKMIDESNLEFINIDYDRIKKIFIKLVNDENFYVRQENNQEESYRVFKLNKIYEVATSVSELLFLEWIGGDVEEPSMVMDINNWESSEPKRKNDEFEMVRSITVIIKGNESPLSHGTTLLFESRQGALTFPMIKEALKYKNPNEKIIFQSVHEKDAFNIVKKAIKIKSISYPDGLEKNENLNDIVAKNVKTLFLKKGKNKQEDFEKKTHAFLEGLINNNTDQSIDSGLTFRSDFYIKVDIEDENGKSKIINLESTQKKIFIKCKKEYKINGLCIESAIELITQKVCNPQNDKITRKIYEKIQ